jgi:hypothetical protein
MFKDVVERIYKRLNVFARIDIIGNPSFYDYPTRHANFVIKFSSQSFAVLFMIQKITFKEILPGGASSIFERYATISIEYIEVSLLALLCIGYTMKFSLRVVNYLSGGSWVPFARLATESEFKPTYDLYAELFKDQVTMPYQVAHSLFERNLLHLYVVYKERMTGDRERRICGFFAINSLSEAGLRNVTTGRKNGRHFDSSDLVDDPAKASAIYVGAMGARLMMDKAYTMRELLRLAFELPDMRLLGRPSTTDGRRIAKKYGWRPLEGQKPGVLLDAWEGLKPRF